MPEKEFNPEGNTFKVTFALPAEVQAESACLCGDFNEWDQSTHPLEKQADGSFRLTLDLAAGRHYHYRFFLNGERWENDWQADAYIPNEFGSEDSVLNLEVTGS